MVEVRDLRDGSGPWNVIYMREPDLWEEPSIALSDFKSRRAAQRFIDCLADSMQAWEQMYNRPVRCRFILWKA